MKNNSMKQRDLLRLVRDGFLKAVAPEGQKQFIDIFNSMSNDPGEMVLTLFAYAMKHFNKENEQQIFLLGQLNGVAMCLTTMEIGKADMTHFMSQFTTEAKPQHPRAEKLYNDNSNAPSAFRAMG